jgi:hypothetical protein
MVSRTSGLKRLLGSVSDVAVVASVAEPCASFSLCDGGKSRIGFAPNAIANRFWIPMRYSSGVSPGRSTCPQCSLSFKLFASARSASESLRISVRHSCFRLAEDYSRLRNRY